MYESNIDLILDLWNVIVAPDATLAASDSVKVVPLTAETIVPWGIPVPVTKWLTEIVAGGAISCVTNNVVEFVLAALLVVVPPCICKDACKGASA